MLKKKFPVQERVAAGVSYKDMLKELGILGALIIISLIVFEVGNFFNLSLTIEIILIIVFTAAFGFCPAYLPFGISTCSIEKEKT